MARKRKRRTKRKNDTVKEKKRRLTARDRKIASVIPKSIWRVKTADKETTTRGKEKLSGWKRCIVLERLSDESTKQDSVRVQYFDDTDDEPITYKISDFISAADPAPIHVDVVEDANASVCQEQPVFEREKKATILPLQRRKKSRPETWLNARSGRFDKNKLVKKLMSQESSNTVPKCTTKRCKLDCAKLTLDSVAYARKKFYNFAKIGINQQQNWLSFYVRPIARKSSDLQIWSNYVKSNVKPGRKTWSCVYCKCNPDSPADFEITDVKHVFKRVKKRVDSKYAACPYYDAGFEFMHRTIMAVRQNSRHHTYHVPVSDEAEYSVHRSVFGKIFHLGQRALQRCCKNEMMIDGRAGSSGRKPHQMLRDKIGNFWINDVDKEGSQYDSTSKKQRCVNVSSVAHGWFIPRTVRQRKVL